MPTNGGIADDKREGPRGVEGDTRAGARDADTLRVPSIFSVLFLLIIHVLMTK